MPRRKGSKRVKKTPTRPVWAKNIPAAQLAAYRRQYEMSGAGQSGGSFWGWLKKAHDWAKRNRVVSTVGRAASEVFPDQDWIREASEFAYNRGYGARQAGGAMIVPTGNKPSVLRFR